MRRTYFRVLKYWTAEDVIAFINDAMMEGAPPDAHITISQLGQRIELNWDERDEG